MKKDERINKITEKLEQGVKELYTSENYRNFLDVVGKFYNYSFNNCLLIHLQMPSATYVAGYKAWQTKFKRQVRKGETAIQILAPVPHKRTVEKEQDGEIVIKQDMSEAQTIKTLVHELAHSVLHKSDGEESEALVNEKEVQAESVAYIVCSYLGLDTSDYSFGYIAGWSEGQDTKELKASMEQIKKTAVGFIEKLAA